VTRTIVREGYRIALRIDPNRAAVPNRFSVGVTRDGRAVRGAEVTATFTMLDMEMGQLSYRLDEVAPGRYERSAPALVMVGHWGLGLSIEPSVGAPLELVVVDRANG
jgi:copper transport protein